MIKIDNDSIDVTGYKVMSKMEPLEVGITKDNEIVMRTASVDQFEVMNLSNPGAGRCWTGTSSRLVAKLTKAITATLS